MDFDLNKSGHMQTLNYADTTKVDKFLVLVRLFPFILKIVHLNQFCAWYKVYLPSSATPLWILVHWMCTSSIAAVV